MEQQDFRSLLQSGGTERGQTATSLHGANNQSNRGRTRGGTASRSPRAANFLAPRRKRTGKGQTGKDIDERAVGSSKGEKRKKSLLAEGYTDRVRERSTAAEDEKQKLINELRDLLKRKKLSQDEYFKRLEELSTGDLESAGFVSGLDHKLLARIRAGEDVLLDPTKVVDDAQAEANLEAAFEQAAVRPQASQQIDLGKTDVAAGPSKSASSRDSLLASLTKTKRKDKSVADPALGNKFKRIKSNNPDGSTTESYEENGQKIKLIRDSKGQIIKKLIKKAKVSPVKTEVIARDEEQQQPTPVAVVDPIKEQAMPQIELENEVDEDIFADAGEYDPFASTEDRPQDDNRGPGTNDSRKSYFVGESFKQTSSAMEGEDDGADASVPQNVKDFLTRHQPTLAEATATMERQKEAEQRKWMAKKRHDAGFGLVFGDDDAYALDLREVPDEEEEGPGAAKKQLGVDKHDKKGQNSHR